MKTPINYSCILFLLIFLALVIVPFSCGKVSLKDYLELANSVLLIKVSGEDAVTATKTTLSDLVTSWVMDVDQVGIYSSQARTATGGCGSAIINAQFTAASTSHTFYTYVRYI